MKRSWIGLMGGFLVLAIVSVVQAQDRSRGAGQGALNGAINGAIIGGIVGAIGGGIGWLFKKKKNDDQPK